MASESAASHLDMLPPAGWACHELGDLVDQDRGISYGIVQPGKNDISGVPIVRVNNIRAGRIETSDVLRVSPTTEQKYQRTRLRGGEVLLSLVGTLGECAVVPQELAGWNVARAVAVIPLKDGINSRWVVTCLRSRQLQHLIRTWATTTVQATLNLRDVRRLPVLMPPDGEVKALMNLVNPFDDKIELNRQINHTLETMARAIFKAWFVDFEPVKAKAAGATSFRGMPQDVFDQLPARLTGSDLGPVPEGWEIKAVSAIADYVNGKAFTKHANGRGRMIIRIAELNSGPGGATKYSDIEADPQYTAFLDDILFAWSGSLNVYRWHLDEAIINQHIFKVIPKGWSKWYVYYRLVQAMPFFQGIAATKATTMGHIKRGHLDDAKFAEPPKWLVEAADEQIRPLYELVHCQERQSQTLSATRDALLPKLISGEIRVPEALEGTPCR